MTQVARATSSKTSLHGAHLGGSPERTLEGLAQVRGIPPVTGRGDLTSELHVFAKVLKYPWVLHALHVHIVLAHLPLVCLKRVHSTPSLA